jgi:hypothetical protein
MKAKKGFKLREICGENIIVADGIENIDFSSIISMNESSAYLWKAIQDKEQFSTEELAALLTEQYEVDEATALADSQMLVDQWLKAGIIDS